MAEDCIQGIALGLGGWSAYLIPLTFCKPVSMLTFINVVINI